MNCPRCETECGPQASFCQKCGNKLGDGKLGPIWGPIAAINWSVIFLPPLAIYLHMMNWRTLRNEEYTFKSKIWFKVSLISLFASLIGIAIPFPLIRGIIYHSPYLLLIVWYFLIGNKQVAYVKSLNRLDLTKKSWTMPIMAGIGMRFIHTAITAVLMHHLGID